MKITKAQLKKIIKEEFGRVLNEDYDQLMQALRDKYTDRQEVDIETCKEINRQFQELTGDPLRGPCVHTDRGGTLELD